MALEVVIKTTSTSNMVDIMTTLALQLSQYHHRSRLISSLMLIGPFLYHVTVCGLHSYVVYSIIKKIVIWLQTWLVAWFKCVVGNHSEFGTVQVMDWCRTGDKSSHEPMMTIWRTYIISWIHYAVHLFHHLVSVMLCAVRGQAKNWTRLTYGQLNPCVQTSYQIWIKDN